MIVEYLKRNQISLMFVSVAGQVGIVIDATYADPETNKTEDIAAAETFIQFSVIKFIVIMVMIIIIFSDIISFSGYTFI